MRNFTYYNINETNLHIDVCEWLENMGLKETQWILDTDWILTQTSRLTFKEWVDG